MLSACDTQKYHTTHCSLDSEQVIQKAAWLVT